jgi:hypothetical protein
MTQHGVDYPTLSSPLARRVGGDVRVHTGVRT